MSENGNGPRHDLDGIISELHDLSNSIQMRVDHLRASLRVQEAELRRIQQMLRTATGEGKPGPKPNSKKERSQPVRFGEEELTILLTKIRALPPVVDDIPGSFTVKHLRDNLGITKPVAERAVNYLRETDYIRMVAARKLGGNGRESRIFVVNDEQ